MSDFDKEAEREKLRRQFAADEEKREVTERMSELLLQGATMTNRHCNTCHSPVFTYQDQAFCPTCQVEIDESGSEAAETDPETVAPTDADGESGSSTRIEVDEPGGSTGPDPSPSAETDSASEPAREPDAASDRRSSEATAPSEPAPSASPPVTDAASTGEPAPASTRHTEDTDGTASAGDSDLAAAQASLSRTLARLSRNAERSEDLSRTRDYLLAAQEAADALAALKQARR